MKKLIEHMDDHPGPYVFFGILIWVSLLFSMVFYDSHLKRQTNIEIARIYAEAGVQPIIFKTAKWPMTAFPPHSSHRYDETPWETVANEDRRHRYMNPPSHPITDQEIEAWNMKRIQEQAEDILKKQDK